MMCDTPLNWYNLAEVPWWTAVQTCAAVTRSQLARNYLFAHANNPWAQFIIECWYRA